MAAKKGKARPRHGQTVTSWASRGSATRGRDTSDIPSSSIGRASCSSSPSIAVLWVPFYNRIEPSLGGIPFFYWYQLAWVLIGAALVLAVYLLETRVTRRHAAHRRASVDPGATGDVL